MTKINVVELPSEAEMGPAMRALPNDRWRRFVGALAQIETTTGQVNYTQAAADAGYATTDRNSLGVIGHKLAHDERIQAALLEESKRRIKAALPIATAAVIKILTNPLAKAADVMKAATILMDRGGMPMTTEHNVKVEHPKTEQEEILDTIRLCRELGMDPKAVLGNLGYAMPQLPSPVQHAGQVVDAEFTEGDPYLKDFL